MFALYQHVEHFLLLRVQAENKFGIGNAVETAPVITSNPFKVPQAPEKPETSNVHCKGLILTWYRPKIDGGSEINNYIVEKREKLGSKWLAVTSRPIGECRLKIAGLQEGQEYEFRVRISEFFVGTI